MLSVSAGYRKDKTLIDLELRMAVALTFSDLGIELWHLISIWAWLGTGSWASFFEWVKEGGIPIKGAGGQEAN